jgi:hypothetical protein
MRITGYWLPRQIVHCLVMLLAVPFGKAAMALPQQALPGQQAEGVSLAQAQPQNSDSGTKTPGADTTQPAASPGNPGSVPAQTTDDNRQNGDPQTTPEQQQSGTQGPVGTAAAPYEKGIGVAASRPAGAVIAPAKQRRTRSILIKVGVLLAAGAAIGTVVALSSASPSRSH